MSPQKLERQARIAIRSIAIYDVFSTASFATPWTLALFYQAACMFEPVPAFYPIHSLFANIVGSLVLVWAAVRLWKPHPIMGAFDLVSRSVFLTWEVYYLLAGGPSLLLPFAIMEVVSGVVVAWPLARLWKARGREAFELGRSTEQAKG